MGKSATIHITTAKKLLSELEEFEKLKVRILKLIPESMIPYGSTLWWEKSEMEADEDIKSGRYAVYKNADDLIKDLHQSK